MRFHRPVGQEGEREGIVLFLVTIGITSVVTHLVYTVVQCVLGGYTLHTNFPLTLLGIPPVIHVIILFSFHL